MCNIPGMADQGAAAFELLEGEVAQDESEEANKTDDEKLEDGGLLVQAVVTDIITDDMKHDLAGRETPISDEEKAGAA